MCIFFLEDRCTILLIGVFLKKIPKPGPSRKSDYVFKVLDRVVNNILDIEMCFYLVE